MHLSKKKVSNISFSAHLPLSNSNNSRYIFINRKKRTIGSFSQYLQSTLPVDLKTHIKISVQMLCTVLYILNTPATQYIYIYPVTVVVSHGPQSSQSQPVNTKLTHPIYYYYYYAGHPRNKSIQRYIYILYLAQLCYCNLYLYLYFSVTAGENFALHFANK